jgi:hypothetical protein
MATILPRKISTNELAESTLMADRLYRNTKGLGLTQALVFERQN